MANEKKPIMPQASGYSEAGASTRKRAVRSFLPNSGSPTDDILRNAKTLRGRSRLLYMASPVATAAINTNRTKVVGTGLDLQCTVDRDILGLTKEQAKEWQTQTEAEFSVWAENKRNCDALGLNNFKALQQLAMKSWLTSGDVFALFKREQRTKMQPYSLRIQLLEADLVATPDKAGSIGDVEGTASNGRKIYDGVEVDSSGMVRAYHVRSTYPYQASSEPNKWTRVEAVGPRTGIPNILHIMDSDRPGQYRGVPYLANVIEPLLQLRRYTESELMAALVQSFFTAWITTESDPMAIPINEIGGGDFGGTAVESGIGENMSQSENEYEMGAGTVLHLAEGEKVEFGNPNIPTAGFDTFVMTLCKLIGAALELPSEILLKTFSSNYSASRGAILEAWEAFKMRRSWFVDDFCQPVYEAWLAEAVALGRIKAPGFFDDPRIRAAWCSAMWIGPIQGTLDPEKEVNANLTMARNGIKTMTQVTREMAGGDFDSNAEQLIEEMRKLQDAFLEQTETIPDEPKKPEEVDNNG